MTEALLAAGTAVGRYEIRGLLGAGGMGEVYEAWDASLERSIAVKVLPRALTSDPHRVKRFLTEARAASALTHPAIVTIYEVGETTEGLHYIAMELIEGTTLDAWAKEDPPLESLLFQLGQVAEGIGKAHARGIVHRDLKPDNIMVTIDGHAKVLDFGVAKLIDPGLGSVDGPAAARPRTLTESTTLLGTVGYMSPEQIEGFALDHRADIFSFGCVLYECVTGRSPFVGASRAETLHNIVHRDPLPLALDDRRLADGLQRIVDRCLAKDREQRYDSARDLSLDLLQVVGGGAPARLSRKARKQRSPLVRAAGVAAVLVGALILRAPAGAIVDTVTATVAPSKHPEVRRLERVLEALRTQNETVTASLTEREREIARRGVEIDKLRADREVGERLRTDLESSYRKLLADVGAHLQRNTSERSQLRERVSNAETELRRIRDEADQSREQQERLSRIQRELGPVMEARLEARGVVVTIPGALFRTARSDIDPQGQAMVQRVAEQLVAHPAVKITIEGHSDSSGSSNSNMVLSQERADNVRSQLMYAGVDQARITAIGRGDLFPAFNEQAFGPDVRNRRIEMVLSH